MDEIEKRLRETTDACIKSFESWHKANKSLEAREELMETMHEVRKVISRLEIEIAISERDRLGSRPIPIPPHRSSMKPSGPDDGDMGDAGFDQQPNNNRHGNDGGRRHNNNMHGRNRRPMQGGGRSGGGGNAAPSDNNGNNADNT